MESILDFFTSGSTWFFIFVLVTILKSVKFVPQNRAYVIYRFGKYTRTLSAGINFLVPYIDSIAADRNLKEQTVDLPKQNTYTKDNISITIDGILFFKVIDAAAATNNITDYKNACCQLAMTSVRSAIGGMDLDECFQKRSEINSKVLEDMRNATQPWGVQVLRFEILEVTVSDSVKFAMEKQMTAEREKRETNLNADAVKYSLITAAEGRKQAAELDAAAEKQAQILRAEGEADAIRLVADAQAYALKAVGLVAQEAGGQQAISLQLAQGAIEAHKAIAKEGTVIVTDGNTGDNISKTVAQAVAVSTAIKSTV